jgi:hypothetical protein
MRPHVAQPADAGLPRAEAVRPHQVDKRAGAAEPSLQRTVMTLGAASAMRRRAAETAAGGGVQSSKGGSETWIDGGRWPELASSHPSDSVVKGELASRVGEVDRGRHRTVP